MRNNDNAATRTRPMAYLQKSTSAGFDYGGFFKQELAKQHAKTQQALVPQTASGSGCNLDDARTGDAAWKCVCRATDFGMSELPGAASTERISAASEAVSPRSSRIAKDV